MHCFWVIVAITLSAAGAFFVVPFTKNTIGGEAKTSNVVGRGIDSTAVWEKDQDSGFR
ncbi:hypothetical protein [Enterococcus faecium]|uniref:hypothetical protein n=1 Tax=Enterococcus faecium TaxID=1352 RepID=UPI001E488447|nr:hypothetical protein [Enterococcus faecium]MCD4888249.1 hypothetical protein [Enterococcus faecium]